MDRREKDKDLGSVLIVGLGISGRAAVRYLMPYMGSRVSRLAICADSFSSDELAWLEKTASAGGVSLRFPEKACGNESSDDSEHCGKIIDVISTPAGSRFDLCIISPGISELTKLYVDSRAASAEIISEVEFAWRESRHDSIWIAVSGTNGKTTTTSLIAHILKSCGKDAYAAGNIGQSVLDCVSHLPAAKEAPFIVVEASSFQLASCRDFAPQVYVLLGITPDHITWHGTFENYAQSKFKILDKLTRDSLAVLDATNGIVRDKIDEIECSGADFEYMPVSLGPGLGDRRDVAGRPAQAFCDGQGDLVVRLGGCEHRLCNRDDLQLRGPHNAINALCASAACIFLGLSDTEIASALKTFAPLEHRIEPVGRMRGVDFYNDSKATNVDSTIVALSSFLPRKPIVMLGGKDKLTDLAPLVESCRKYASAAVCFGEAKERFTGALQEIQGDGFRLAQADSFDQAFDAALRLSKAGDVVLLSPACSSFDEFSSFEERGAHFKELVGALAGK